MFITNSQLTIQMAPTWLCVHNTSANKSSMCNCVNSIKAATKLLHKGHFIRSFLNHHLQGVRRLQALVGFKIEQMALKKNNIICVWFTIFCEIKSCLFLLLNQQLHTTSFSYLLKNNTGLIYANWHHFLIFACRLGNFLFLS